MRAQLLGAFRSLSAMIPRWHGLLSGANLLAAQCQPVFVHNSYKKKDQKFSLFVNWGVGSVLMNDLLRMLLKEQEGNLDKVEGTKCVCSDCVNPFDSRVMPYN